MTAFWCRGTSAASLTPPNVPAPDHAARPPTGTRSRGTNLAGGIAAALFKRERTGESSVVDVSLLGSGLWTMGHALAVSLCLGRAWEAPPLGVHGAPANPLSGLYRTADDRYLSLVMLQPGKFWADVCRHVDHPEWATDPRFATVEQLAANTAEAVKLLQEVIGSRTLAEWAERFATLAGPWAPVQDTLQAGRDAQVRANEYILPAGDSSWPPRPCSSTSPPRTCGRPPSSPRRPRRSCSNSAWTGTASSPSRKPAPSPDRPVPPAAASPAGSPRCRLTGRFPPPSPDRPVPPAVTSPAGSPRRHLTGRFPPPSPHRPLWHPLPQIRHPHSADWEAYVEDPA